MSSACQFPVPTRRSAERNPPSVSETEPLRLVYVLLYFPYLTETFVADEILALRARGHDVRIVSLLLPPAGLVQPQSQDLLPYTTFAPGVFSCALWRAQLHFLRRRFPAYLQLLYELLRQPLNEQPIRSVATRLVVFMKAVWLAQSQEHQSAALFHSHFAWLSSAAARVCGKLLRKPFSITAHAYDVFSPKNDMLQLVSRDAAHVVVISEFNRWHILRTTECAPQRISVVHCGVDAQRIPRNLNAARVTTGNPIRILSVGSLVAKKGHDHLLAACSILAERRCEFTCTIIGGGPQERRLRKQLEDSGLSGLVTLRGAVSHIEVCEALGEHDVFVLACVVAPNGNRDGIPVALMEAAHAAMPIVSTRVSGIPELVRNLDTGLLVAPASPPELADAILALTSDVKLMLRLGRNAQLHAQRSFGIHETTGQLANIFHEVVASHATVPRVRSRALQSA